MSIARPLKVLVPLIHQDLSASFAAGLEHYRRVGEMLLEAREQVAADKWGTFLSKYCDLRRMEAWRYMTLAEMAREDPRVMHDTARLILELQTRKHEVRLHRELAAKVIDIGFRALATRLHPDHGGSKDAMQRLNRVRDKCKSIAKRNRFM